MLEKFRVPRFIYRIISNLYYKKPEMAELMQIRYPYLKAVVNSGLNEICYQLKVKKIPRLVSLTIEPVNSCNLRCQMCPVNNGMKRKKELMNFDLFKKIIDDNPNLEFILLFLWGEPLLHPKIFEMIEYIAKKGIRPVLTTNSTLFTPKIINKIAKSKLDRITISMDGIKDTYEKIRGVSYAQTEKNVMNLIAARNRTKSAVKIDLTMVITKDSEGNVDSFIKRWKGVVDRIQLQPSIELVDKKLANRNKQDRCRELWRGNLVVLSNGYIVPCCVDYEGVMKIGDAKEKRIVDILNCQPMQKLREDHNRGKFTLACRYCQEYLTSKVRPRYRWVN